jgi:hypothetical protein
MSDRFQEPRWRFRLLVLDLLFAIAVRVGVDEAKLSELRNRAASLRGDVARG